MNSRSCTARVLPVLWAGLVVAADAGASIITSVSSALLPGTSTGAIGPVTTPSPNNDNTGAASANAIPASIFFNTFGAAEIEFNVAASGGTTEYFLTQTLINNTGVPWTGFQFALGFGTGASFVSSGTVDSLDLDAPDRDPAPTSSIFTTLNHQADSLDWSGGSLPLFGTVLFWFSIDVPDGLSSFHPSGLNRFTLRQVPITTSVPEPGTLALLGLGLAGLAASRRRKQ